MYGFESHLKTKIDIDILEDLETQLKNYGPLKDRNLFTLFLEAPKTPKLRQLRVNSPRLRRPLKLNRGKEEEEETKSFSKSAENFRDYTLH